MDIQSANLHRT